MISDKFIEQGNDYLTIKSNEGTMKKTNISVDQSEEKLLIDFSEEYITNKVTTNSQD